MPKLDELEARLPLVHPSELGLPRACERRNAYLEEADLVCVFSERTSRKVESVLSDESLLAAGDSASS